MKFPDQGRHLVFSTCGLMLRMISFTITTQVQKRKSQLTGALAHQYQAHPSKLPQAFTSIGLPIQNFGSLWDLISLSATCRYHITMKGPLTQGGGHLVQVHGMGSPQRGIRVCPTMEIKVLVWMWHLGQAPDYNQFAAYITLGFHISNPNGSQQLMLIVDFLHGIQIPPSIQRIRRTVIGSACARVNAKLYFLVIKPTGLYCGINGRIVIKLYNYILTLKQIFKLIQTSWLIINIRKPF